MGAFVLTVLAIVAIGAIYAADRRLKLKRRGLLESVGGLLEAPPVLDDKQMTIAGTRLGRAVTYRLTWHGTGKHRRAFTEIDVDLPPLSLELELRAQDLYEETRVKHGLAVDVITGDDAFDRAFIVEAAPADVARELLTDDVRRDLLALKPWRVKRIDDVLRIERYGHVLEHAEAAALVDLGARLGAGVRPAHAAADARLEAAATVQGGPFRAEVDATGIQEKKAARADEVLALELMKDKRARIERVVSIGLIVVTIIVFAILAAQ